MISSSSAYKTQLNSNALTPKSKIIVDNVEYLGDVIKEAPKIKHVSSKFIGTFPAKTVSFTIYDLENEIDFENKEIEVYKGLVVGNSIEYLKQGVFIPKASNIKTNISERTVSFTDVQDRTQILENQYTSQLDWSNDQKHTGLEIVEEICDRHSITLKSDDFPFAEYEFKQPNFVENITDRGVLAALAEIGGGIAIFDSNGQLEIKTQYDTEHTIQRKKYEKVSYEKEVTINTVVLGKEGVNDDIIYPEIIETERVEAKILDNPFVDLYREEMIEDVADYIIGTAYVPFNMEGFVDGYMYELNDTITVIDKNDNQFTAVILDIENTSRIKSKTSAPGLENKKTEYNLAGSSRQGLDQVKLDVDHVKQEITAVASHMETIDVTVDNNYQEVISKFDNYAPTSDLITLENSVTQFQNDTYTKTEINTKLTDGSVTKVNTTSGTFDENGMHYEKSGAPTASTINHLGVEVEGSTSGEELLFAGYDETLQQTIVRTENLTVRKYLVVGENSRIEDYENGGGIFVL